MTPIRSLLVATDFSEDAQLAARRAGRLAVEHGASLTLLHILSEPALNALRRAFDLELRGEEKLIDEAQSRLRELAAEVEQMYGVVTDARVEVGNVLDRILAAAASADLLVVGAHGRNTLHDVILGTTSDRLLRKSKQPLLVTKRPADRRYERVVVAVDFSPYSVAALRLAARLAPVARIAVVHAFDAVYEGSLRVAGVPSEMVATYCLRERQRALERIGALIDDLGDDPYRFSRSVEQSAAAALILARERELAADLVVIGKHGQSAVEEVLLGSVTRHVLSGSQCDVLVVADGQGER